MGKWAAGQWAMDKPMRVIIVLMVVMLTMTTTMTTTTMTIATMRIASDDGSVGVFNDNWPAVAAAAAAAAVAAETTPLPSPARPLPDSRCLGVSHCQLHTPTHMRKHVSVRPVCAPEYARSQASRSLYNTLA